MGKKSKKRNRRARNLIGGAVMLAPAALAAITAFMNTASTKSRGFLSDLDANRSGKGGKGKGKGKGSN